MEPPGPPQKSVSSDRPEAGRKRKDTSETGPPKKKICRYQWNIGPGTTDMKSTFYVFNVSSPLMVQSSINVLDRTYNPAQMRKEHTIPDEIFEALYYQKEEYIKVMWDNVIGNIFFLRFSSTTPASRAKSGDFMLRRREMSADDILPPVAVHIPTVSYNISFIDCDITTKLTSLVDEIASPANPPERCEALRAEAKSIIENSIIDAPISELALTNCLTVQLKKCGHFQDFIVTTQNAKKAPFHFSKYGLSREDVVLYHKKKYVRDKHVEGAVLSGYGEYEESDSEEYLTYTLEGATAEVKLSRSSSYTSHTSLVNTPEIAQLIAGMEKLAGDLAFCAMTSTQRSPVLFTGTTIFGVLMNYGSKRSILVKLNIDFVKRFSSFYVSTDDVDINDALDRLHFYLNRDTN